MEENNNKNEQERKKMIQNNFYGDVKNVVNGDYFDYSTNEVEKKESPKMTTEVLHQLINNVQAYLWGQSAYAVFFCLGRDKYGYPNNMSMFEREIEPLTIGLEYECHAGTIQKTLSNNPYMKLPVDKWAENGAPKRVLLLMDKINEEIIKREIADEEFLK